MTLKLGRLPRHFNPAIPSMSALIANCRPPAPPAAVSEYMDKMPADSGMMLNDRLGDCTAAAMYHAIQLWTAVCDGSPQTNSDDCVLKAYEDFCGYKNDDPSTDQGGVEQTVLRDWMMCGVKIDVAGVPSPNKLAAFIEVDPRIHDDIKRTIYDCGVCYIGFEVPDNILPSGGDPPKLWQYDPHASIVGGHAVALCGYDDQGPTLISWGGKYQMTWEFFSRYTDEAYALVDPEWLNATGKTPLGFSLQELTDQMRALHMQWHSQHSSP